MSVMTEKCQSLDLKKTEIRQVATFKHLPYKHILCTIGIMMNSLTDCAHFKAEKCFEIRRFSLL